MNATLLAQTAYSANRPTIRTDRGTEYELIARITRDLKAAKTGRSAFPALARAVHDNRVLWSTLAADVAGSGNALPQDLRARLFYLAEFTALHSRKVLAGEADCTALIEINTAIMRGLTNQTEAAQ
ncbi:MAG: flagellar biosynthesis regulator FlaF [Rhodobacteraceae bacterium]|nr:flagellar biosynthesis regulator FlaF [Paracoccaceae bacterium]